MDAREHAADMTSDVGATRKSSRGESCVSAKHIRSRETILQTMGQAARSSVVTIGNFDGVHLGHREIVRRARTIAERSARPSEARPAVVAITFHPHPVSVLRPGMAPAALASIDRRAALLRDAGADEVRVIEPTAAMLAVSASQFLASLRDEFCPIAIVEGTNFHFGHNREGNAEFLRRESSKHGFEAVVVPSVEAVLCDQTLVTVSSSLVRWLLTQGRVADAYRCLGRAHELEGVVTRGEQRGRTIGVPTVNLPGDALAWAVLPADGVYAGVVTLDDATRWNAAISVGEKPTFGRVGRVVEAHLLDFRGDLYGRRVRVAFHRWLRDQQRFPGIDALKAQLACDIALARRWGEAGMFDHAPTQPLEAVSTTATTGARA